MVGVTVWVLLFEYKYYSYFVDILIGIKTVDFLEFFHLCSKTQYVYANNKNI